MRGRPKIKEGAPCSRGHPYSRNKHNRCRFCEWERHHKREVQRKRWREPPAWIAERELAFVWTARLALGKRGAGGHKPSLEALVQLWDAQNGRCAITQLAIEGTPQLDHIVPVSIGGTNALHNLQWTSQMANRAKGAHSTDEVRAWILAAAEAIRSKC